MKWLIEIISWINWNHIMINWFFTADYTNNEINYEEYSRNWFRNGSLLAGPGEPSVITSGSARRCRSAAGHAPDVLPNYKYIMCWSPAASASGSALLKKSFSSKLLVITGPLSSSKIFFEKSWKKYLTVLPSSCYISTVNSNTVTRHNKIQLEKEI